MNGHTLGQPPFPQAWWSFDLGRYRGCDGTYCFYTHDSLPPIPAVSESLEWLEPLNPGMEQEMAIHRNLPEARGEVAKIAETAAQLGLTLPESFIRLMSSPELQDRMPSCTACFFKLSDDIMPCPGSDGGYIVRFYKDQQDVLLWYLYLTPQGAHYVLVTPIELEEMAAESLSDEERQSIQQNTWVCALSFVSFIYRWWLENSIWFKVSDDADFVDAGMLTDAERAYLAHYEASNTSGASSQ
jgi:hypothetical protein